MVTREEIKVKLKRNVIKNRFIHSINVMELAAELASVYGVDQEKAAIAGLLHDCAKNIELDRMLMLCDEFDIVVDDVERLQPKLLHGRVGAVLASKEYGIYDETILNAIRYHTLGRENMTMMEKIVFVSDYIEPNREFEGIEEVRELAFIDIDKTMIISLNNIIVHIIAKGALVHPVAIMARNDMIKKRM
ncbi:bis(5'-nucleosyl)-tetraphosphatase (symmetrical) YqeK [Herbivorax sp. ANBcel31]|uniref:bis(5'-nucleosyl)-tetraphosphatase (symmetrical) YqeK n=1 Tax=Herbivorax sp. ANBcel31 TaxID=3069754 RepID=UPI0027B814E8|nr:bis(5'-nucleosyl)-tetraphosphatase (symmetrical) YqeK [Herbivorax sp. ANBcel31]MDQ2087381.1 bis(5'-nucleosyl)-tetraphosphatase (symmetrical) YqeK [Herbivorax sp. ANBcel31]